MIIKKIPLFILITFLSLTINGQPRPEIVIQNGHGSDVTALAFSPFGTLIASGDLWGGVKLWDAKTFQLIYTLENSGRGEIEDLIFNGYGNAVVSRSFSSLERYMGSQYDTLYGYNTLTGAKDWSVFSPQGGTVAFGAQDKYAVTFNKAVESQDHWLFQNSLLYLYFTDTSKTPLSLEHTDKITALAFDEKGGKLLFGDDKGKVFLMDAENLNPIYSLFDGEEQVVRHLLFSDKRQFIIYSTLRNYTGAKSKLKIFTMNGLDTVYTFIPQKNNRYNESISSVALSSDEKYLALAYDSFSLKVIDLEKLEDIFDMDLGGSVGRISSLSFFPDSHILLLGGEPLSFTDDGYIKVFNFADTTILHTFSYPSNDLSIFDFEVGFLPDNSIYGHYRGENDFHLVESTELREKISGGDDLLSVDIFGKKERIDAFNFHRGKSIDIVPGNSMANMFIRGTKNNKNYFFRYDLISQRITNKQIIPAFDKNYLNFICEIPGEKNKIFTGGDLGDKQFIILDSNFTQIYSDSLLAYTEGILHSPDGKFITYFRPDSNLVLLDLSDLKFKYKFTWKEKFNHIQFDFTSDSRYLIHTNEKPPENDSIKNSIRLISLENFELSGEIRAPLYSTELKASRNPDIFAIAAWANYKLLLVNYKKDEVIFNKNFPAEIVQIDFSFDNKRMLVLTADGITYLYDVEKQEEILKKVEVRGGRCFITPDNYYLADKAAISSIGFRVGNRAFPFEQFDLRFNRPDIVLERFGETPKHLLSAYQSAARKRLKQYGLDLTQSDFDFHLPEISIDRRTLPSITGDRIIELKISAKDSLYNLKRIQIYINGIPIHGVNGIDLSNNNSGEAQMIDEIELSLGQNKIQVSVMNEKGIESLKENANINCAASESKPNLYIIAMSVSKYADNNFNLGYARKDGRDIIDLFGNEKDKFKKIFIDSLFDQSATRENFLKLKEKLMDSDVDDEVILFISGHGLLDENLDFYFATHDCDFDDPAERGVLYDDIENLLDGIPARKKLLLMDACHSGEVDKENIVVNETVDLPDGGKSGMKVYDYRGGGTDVVDEESEEKRIGLQNSFELMQQLFANLNRGSGAVVISAAAGKGYALESPKWKNGVFTYCVKSGLLENNFGGFSAADKNKDGGVSVNELKDYVFTEVERLTNGAQKPTSRRENFEVDFKIF